MATQNRRSFVTVLASFAGMAALDAQAPPPAAPQAASVQWDPSWFDALKGRHKQMYDTGRGIWVRTCVRCGT